MEHIGLFFFFAVVFLENEGLGSAEAVVKYPYLVRIAQRKTSVLTGEVVREFVKYLKISSNWYRGIEEDGDDGLCGTGIVDYLPCKE